ncbi:hypothetical protein FE633_13155 [Streptomyces montanus]|uniref:Uncharacterized protein n=1 Tax=Streptomyces montanus TaxID=2580423 RepID=A0A5R9FUZ5_9ACTN|nr:hypothetical protein [Streptomyces montanus]TLS45710.1 hypothetical protein FE633_13155 [Streptomyces montanus]
MSRSIPLKTPLDESGLWHKTPFTTPHSTAGTAERQLPVHTLLPVQGESAMPLGHTVTVTSGEMHEIFERLAPHLPPCLRKVKPRPSGYGLCFEFAPFTGREDEPTKPRALYDDPKLTYVPESDDPAEHQLRQTAGLIIDEVYDTAREEWKDAVYVADLKQVVKDAPDRWKTYEREMKALESAYTYLRTPEASHEWPSALSRLVDAQDRTMAAAIAFDERALDIAAAHRTHLYADLGHDAALGKAGYPEARDWHIVSAEDYGSGYFSAWSTSVPLQERVRRLVAEQDAHVSKVGRLSSMATS